MTAYPDTIFQEPLALLSPPTFQQEGTTLGHYLCRLARAAVGSTLMYFPEPADKKAVWSVDFNRAR